VCLYLSPALAQIELDGGVGVDGIPLVGVDGHTEQTRVRLQRLGLVNVRTHGVHMCAVHIKFARKVLFAKWSPAARRMKRVQFYRNITATVFLPCLCSL
jgi:hypothetical protein